MSIQRKIICSLTTAAAGAALLVSALPAAAATPESITAMAPGDYICCKAPCPGSGNGGMDWLPL